MKNFIAILTVLLLANNINAQWWGNDKVKGDGNVITEKRNVGTFDGVSSAGFMKVKLIEGTEGEITLNGEANLLDYIETEVSGDILKIKVKNGYSLKPSMGNKILITVPVTRISKLSLAGSGSLISETILNSDDFKISVAGSGNLNAEIEADELKVSLAGSGNLNLSGNATEMKLSIAGSGNFNAPKMKVMDISASIAGSGNARVHCDGSIKARIVGSGNLKYTGNPDVENTSSLGSGKVVKI
jgi:hypothetical protein